MNDSSVARTKLCEKEEWPRIPNIFIIPAATSQVFPAATRRHSLPSAQWPACETRCVGAGAAIAQPHSEARSAPDGSMVAGAEVTDGLYYFEERWG